MSEHDEQWTFRRARPLPRDGKTLIMGIVNLTPDSFSTGTGGVPSPEAAARTALAMLADGADIVDFGAESSRPGAVPLGAAEEMARLGDVIARVRAETDAPLSVDTYHSETAAFVLDQGADIINDITALRGGWEREAGVDPAMAELTAREGAHVILMHMPSAPAEMQQSPEYLDVVEEVREFLLGQAEAARLAGIAADRIWLDPGFGFGKTFRHNRDLLLSLGEFAELDYPVAIGLSRKRMIEDALGLPRGERLEASLALAVVASLSGADLVRVHDVRETARAVGMVDALCRE